MPSRQMRSVGACGSHFVQFTTCFPIVHGRNVWRPTFKHWMRCMVHRPPGMNLTLPLDQSLHHRCPRQVGEVADRRVGGELEEVGGGVVGALLVGGGGGGTQLGHHGGETPLLDISMGCPIPRMMTVPLDHPIALMMHLLTPQHLPPPLLHDHPIAPNHRHPQSI